MKYRREEDFQNLEVEVQKDIDWLSLCKVERWIRNLRHIFYLMEAWPPIWITSFLKSLDRTKLQPYLLIENMPTNSNFKLWRERLFNGCKTSKVWLPSMSRLHPIRPCFSVTCSRLDENDGSDSTEEKKKRRKTWLCSVPFPHDMNVCNVQENKLCVLIVLLYLITTSFGLKLLIIIIIIIIITITIY